MSRSPISVTTVKRTTRDVRTRFAATPSPADSRVAAATRSSLARAREHACGALTRRAPLQWVGRVAASPHRRIAAHESLTSAGLRTYRMVRTAVMIFVCGARRQGAGLQS